MSRWVDVGPLADLKFAPGAALRIGDLWLAVFPLDGGYVAIDNACPHAGAPLCDGAVLDGKVVCFLHLWEFDLRTGACSAGADWNVRSYAVRVADGRLAIELPEPPRIPS